MTTIKMPTLPLKLRQPGGPSVNLMLPVATLAVGVALVLSGDVTDHMPLLAQIALSSVLLALAFWTVFVALHHAEALAHRIGEPYGALILTLAVTAIEASVIVSVMLTGQPNPAIARESVFSTIMIVCAGMLGICLTLGGLRHHHQDHKRQGTSALLAVVVALSVLTLVLPNYTLAAQAGDFSPVQLVLVGLLCLLLYGSFLFAELTRYRDDFLDGHEAPRTQSHGVQGGLWSSIALLLIGLVGIVLLAEHVATSLEHSLAPYHLAQTDAIVGAFIATLVLMPETVAAIRAALRNEVQRAVNIALGSACATIGLTVPIVAAVSLITGTKLTLGLAPGDMVLLALALAVSTISFGTGRTTVVTGAVHLVVFVAYLLLIVVP